MKNSYLFCCLLLMNMSTVLAQKTPPNVIVILVDDMGYSDIGIFGSEIKTPNIDLLGKKGAIFTQFYNAGRCCPSRASLLTGMYPHQAGMGGMVNTGDYDRNNTGSYQGFLNVNTPTIAEELKKNGYNTYMTGKWHVGEKKPDWPNQRGFDHFYGLISGANSYYELLPKRQLVEDNEPFAPKGNYYFTDAISDKSVSYLQKNKSTGKPFFLYVAYTAPHWPIHAPQDLIDSYKSKYIQGWEALRKQRFIQQNKGVWVIEVRAPHLPLLMHELVKGAEYYDSLFSLPQQKEVGDVLMGITDVHKHEIQNMNYGRSLWSKIRYILEEMVDGYDPSMENDLTFELEGLGPKVYNRYMDGIVKDDNKIIGEFIKKCEEIVKTL